MSAETLIAVYWRLTDVKVRLALQALFALGVYLYSQGQSSTGLKMCTVSLEAANASEQEIEDWVRSIVMAVPKK